jgi:integral membrane protein (TIGR01906 family)
MLTGIRAMLLVCVPLLLLLSNLYLVATPAFIRHEYGKSDFPPSEVYDSSERLSLALATLRYVRSGAGTGQLTALSSQGRAVYNEREVQHLADVRRVIHGAFLLHGGCVLLASLAIALAWRAQERSTLLQSIYHGCQILLVALVAIGLLAYTSFDVFFTAFHRIFFSGDSWLFAYIDTLIQLFPVPFWMDATGALALLAIAESLLVGGICYGLSRRRGAQR